MARWHNTEQQAWGQDREAKSSGLSHSRQAESTLEVGKAFSSSLASSAIINSPGRLHCPHLPKQCHQLGQLFTQTHRNKMFKVKFLPPVSLNILDLLTLNVSTYGYLGIKEAEILHN